MNDPASGSAAAKSRQLSIALALWSLAVAAASAAGVFGELYPPLIAVLVAAGIAAPVAWYLCDRALRELIGGWGLKPLTAVHVWRIPAALVFFWYGEQGMLPERFVLHAAWGDLLAGIFALLLMFIPARRNAYLAFHAFGFADFVLAVGTGLAFTLLDDPRMSAIVSFPLALIPLFGVGISGATHLIAFHLLLRSRNLKPPASDVDRAASAS